MTDKGRKYAFSLAERNRLNVSKSGEPDFCNMNKGYYDEIENKDNEIQRIKKSLNLMKEWTVKESVYSNLEIPKTWKTRLGYREELLKFIGDDPNFCNYLVKINGGSTLDTLNNGKIITDNKENHNNTNNIDYLNSVKTYNIHKKSNIKVFNDASSGSNSSGLFKQAIFDKDPNDSGQVSRKYTNLNITPMDIEVSFNEKIDINQNNPNYEQTPVKTSNNMNTDLIPISETKNKLDEDEVLSPRRSMSKVFGSSRKFNNQISQAITDKEKRTILEHYRNLYSFKKVSPNKNNASLDITKKISSFPLISHNNNLKRLNFNNIENSAENNHANTNRDANPYKSNPNLSETKNNDVENLNATQKNSMFRSSIYSNLMSSGTKFFKKVNNASTNYTKLSENENEMISSENNLSKSKGKNKNFQTNYGPFLHIDNKFEKKIEIKNPDIKRSLEDINYYGPYFSHCPICRFKNLDFYQNMEPHQCLKLLSYIKMKRSKIQLNKNVLN